MPVGRINKVYLFIVLDSNQPDEGDGVDDFRRSKVDKDMTLMSPIRPRFVVGALPSALRVRKFWMKLNKHQRLRTPVYYTNERVGPEKEVAERSFDLEPQETSVDWSN